MKNRGRWVLAVLLWGSLLRADPPSAVVKNLNEIPSDLQVPAVTDEAPAAGRRVRLQNEGYGPGEACHALYLPPDWTPQSKLPLLVEYPGNGGFQNKLGDISTGRVEDCQLGYGISGGRGLLWLCLPFVDPQTRQHQLHWWGDPAATAAYCRQTVRQICRDYGADPEAVIFVGFSRGAIAGGYIGLHDDETAQLWRAFILHSHYDGVRRWNYPEDDRASALRRLSRLKGRPQFVSHEQSVEATREFLQSAGAVNSIEFLALPYPNHSAAWVLKDLPARQQVRDWLAKVLATPKSECAAEGSKQ